MDSRKTWQVQWTITIEAESAYEAAEKALAIQRNPESIATVFEVNDFNRPSDEKEIIDLDEDTTCPTCGEDGGTTCGDPNCGY